MRTSSLVAILTVIVVTSFTLPAGAQSDSASDADARAQFDLGRAAYDDGRFEDAVRAFRRAYVLSPRYQLLYNMGQAELRAGHDSLALQAFEGFLRQAPESDPLRSEVQERVTVLRGMGVTAASEDASASEEPVTEGGVASPGATEPADAQAAEPSRSSGNVAPWIVVGVGAAVLVGGAVLMGVGVSEAQRVTDAPMGSRWALLEGVADTANVLWGVGIGAAALGLAAVGAGIAWALAGSSDASEESAPATLRVGVGSIAIEGTF